MSNMSKSIEELMNEYIPLINKSIENYLPRQFDQKSLEHYFDVPKYAYDINGANKALLDPVWDLLDRGGKRWRPVLLAIISKSIGGKLEDVLPVAFMCEIIHNGSLVIDDIEDDSLMRRGKPCLHILYKMDIAINAGCFMYFAPLKIFQLLRKEGKYSETVINRAYELYSDEMIKIHLGQGLDIWWHNGNRNPSIDEYLQMCAYKTGTLARLSARLAVLFSNGSNELIDEIGSFAEAIGVSFQIQDDILNIVGEEFSQKISCVGEDVYEGKRSLMAIHSIINAPKEESARLVEILNMKTRDQNLIQEAINIMKKNNSIEFATNFAKDLVTKAWTNIEPLLPNNDYKTQIYAFTQYLIKRKV